MKLDADAKKNANNDAVILGGIASTLDKLLKYINMGEFGRAKTDARNVQSSFKALKTIPNETKNRFLDDINAIISEADAKNAETAKSLIFFLKRQLMGLIK